MNAIVMMTSGVAWFAAAAVLALLLSFHKTLSGAIAGIGGAVGSLMTLAAGGVVLIDGQSVDTLIPLIHHAVELTPLNAIWLITFGLCGLFISLFNVDWHRHQHTKANGLLVNLLMAAAVCTVIASNLGALVVMAEIMALCGVFLTGCSASGKLWFALGRLGTLLLALACWLVWQRFGTLDFAALNGQPLGNDVWLLGVVGFGLLAGIIPLHGWVPQAHANASAPAAALFSTVVMKVGLFGILMITLTGGQPPLWWGVALLIAGMITAFVGGLYALMEHNIQRLLAYHTLENIGIILLGMGAGGTKPAGTPGGTKNYRSDDGKKKNNKKTIGIVVGIVAALAIVGLAAFALMGGFATGDPVPDVTGKTVEEATAILKEAGFELGTTDQKYDDKVPAGQIVGQDPKAGDKREKGSKVNVTVSQGVAQITVPDVKGLDAEKAKQAIKDKGLVPSAGTPAYSDTVEKGLVISTNPESGTKVEKNSTVEYIVSLGSEGVEVPNVVGQREGAAVATLNDAGFSVTTDYANSDTVAEGLVISQSPSAGEKGKEGGTVNIVVSSGKAKPTKFTVSASVSGEGGYVSPSSMEVDEGGSITFQVTPNSG